MQSILVLIGGGERDEVIMRTAHAAAIPLGAHLEFLHVRVSASTAMRQDEHAQFAIGRGINNALEEFDTSASAFSQLACDHVLGFVKLLDEQRAGAAPITATYREVYDAQIEYLVEAAGKHDLVVIGRARQKQGLPQNTLERLIRECKRPLLIPTKEAPNNLMGAIMVCWNGSDNVCKTVRACAPLLARAQRLVFVSIGGLDAAAARERDQLSSVFAKQGVSAELQDLPSDGRVPEALARAASELDATLVVMGAYGRWRLRQLFLGSRTEDSLRCIERPILLMH
ncbi:MAG: universal stress protein [Alphaproteobacteria bacterium]|nr:universal stress protein [Alphaproteobacteria bacterium]